jgi:hypothetical protein
MERSRAVAALGYKRHRLSRSCKLSKHVAMSWTCSTYGSEGNSIPVPEWKPDKTCGRHGLLDCSRNVPVPWN